MDNFLLCKRMCLTSCEQIISVCWNQLGTMPSVPEDRSGDGTGAACSGRGGRASWAEGMDDALTYDEGKETTFALAKRELSGLQWLCPSVSFLIIWRLEVWEGTQTAVDDSNCLGRRLPWSSDLFLPLNSLGGIWRSCGSQIGPLLEIPRSGIWLRELPGEAPTHASGKNACLVHRL